MTKSLTSSSAIVPQTSKVGDESQTRQLNHTLPARLRFIVKETHEVVEAFCVNGLIIGRHNSTLPVDVDLAPFEAAELGISRQHLKIEIHEGRILARDLGSANGSRLNGATMTPQYVYELVHGDDLKLGRMHILVYFVYD